ncbi:hypothetical protein ACLSU7_18550 [Bdellovibrio sp. HCB185ZH]|uniref:hypothetical protein n=1 Tax=Bdellovibrio sp. HCB185ZH TaxID=3394235 RepID=UPI0039A45E2C
MQKNIVILILPFISVQIALANSYYASPEKIPNNSYSIEKFQEIKDMPPVLSQDSFGLCYGFSAAAVLNYWNCVAIKKTNKDFKCSDMPESQRFSPVAISRYNGEAIDEGMDDSEFEELWQSGSPKKVFDAVAGRMGRAPSESCASLDQFLSKATAGGTANGYSETQAQIWLALYESYKNVRKKAKCPTCSSDAYAAGEAEKVAGTFNVDSDKDNAKVLQSFGKDSFAKALNELMYPKKCSDPSQSVELKLPMTVKSFPPKNLAKNDGFQIMMDQVVKNLDKNIPTVVMFCSAKNPSKQCDRQFKSVSGSVYPYNENHGAVITGYKKFCPTGNSKEKCYYSVKLQNSYGKQWQKENNDGWIDARSVIDNSFYEQNKLVWLEEEK